MSNHDYENCKITMKVLFKHVDVILLVGLLSYSFVVHLLY